MNDRTINIQRNMAIFDSFTFTDNAKDSIELFVISGK